MERRITYINEVDDAPEAIGPYSQATVMGNMVFISGQIPVDRKTGKLAGSGIEEQAHQVLKNLRAILNHLSLDFWDVMKATVFLTDLGNFKTVNEIYAEHLGAARPARATIQVAALPLGSLIEIEMVAWKGK